MLVDGVSEQVLGFLVRGPLDKPDKVCLAPGAKEGRFNYGILNGYGGKMHLGETVSNAMLRELCQETKLDVRSCKRFRKVALVDVSSPVPEADKPKYGVLGVKTARLHVFLIEGVDLEPKATDEMGMPEWYDVDKLPFARMHPGVELWLPRVLKGECLSGEMTCQVGGVVSEYSFDQLPFQILAMKIAP